MSPSSVAAAAETRMWQLSKLRSESRDATRQQTQQYLQTYTFAAPFVITSLRAVAGRSAGSREGGNFLTCDFRWRRSGRIHRGRSHRFDHPCCGDAIPTRASAGLDEPLCRRGSGVEQSMTSCISNIDGTCPVAPKTAWIGANARRPREAIR